MVIIPPKVIIYNHKYGGIVIYRMG